MQQAAKTGNLADLRLVVEFAPKRVNEAQEHSRYTPLHDAARGGHEAAVSLLLSAKADVNQINSYDRTPLRTVASEGECFGCCCGCWGLPSHRRVKQLLRDAGGK